jgi:hypothetical protein
VVWFSCGAASAVAALLAVEKYGTRCVVVYCDTHRNEHPDNMRFFREVESFLPRKIVLLRSDEFDTVEEVFEKTRYMSGINGARCTVEMKKIPRFKFQRFDDIHVFGLTAEENVRIERFTTNNFELNCDWILRDAGLTKEGCFDRLTELGIELPAMYKLGYRNNNCLGCVKATSPAYWNKIRVDFPKVFERRARQSRALGVRLVRVKGKRIYLDELAAFFELHTPIVESISCGPDCAAPENV